MKIIIVGEYSGTVRDAFIYAGHDAISCDLLPTEIPGPHYQGDVFDIIDRGFDMMIAHPPCTYITVSAEWAYKDRPMIKGVLRNIKHGTLIGRQRRIARIKALGFVKKLWSSNIPKKCLENPKGVIPRLLPELGKPQYIQQYQFGEDASKLTGLYLEGLPELKPTNIIEPRYINGLPRWGNQTDSGQNKLPPSKDRWKIRSTTPQGIANAMAEQWG